MWNNTKITEYIIQGDESKTFKNDLEEHFLYKRAKCFNIDVNNDPNFLDYTDNLVTLCDRQKKETINSATILKKDNPTSKR